MVLKMSKGNVVAALTKLKETEGERRLKRRTEASLTVHRDWILKRGRVREMRSQASTLGDDEDILLDLLNSTTDIELLHSLL